MNQNETILNDALQEGEVVEWKGQPEPFKLTEGENKKGVLMVWAISIVIMAGLSILYTLYTLNAEGAIQPVIYVIVIGCPFIAVVDPVRDRSHICGQLLAITDRRIIIVHKSTNTESKTLNMNLDDIDSIRVEDIEPGFGRISFGSATFEVKAGYKMRRAAIRGTVGAEDALTGLVFYRLTSGDVADVCSKLKDKGYDKKIVV